MKRQLILEDGTVFVGEGFGSDKEMDGGKLCLTPV